MACLNSTPSTPLPEPDDNYESLTLSYFLIGKLTEVLPELLDTHRTGSLVRHWRICRKLAMDFWQPCMIKRIIHPAQMFSKWTNPTKNIQVGDVFVVYVRGPKFPSHYVQWPLARVIQAHPGVDKISRVATTLTSTSQGTFKSLNI